MIARQVLVALAAVAVPFLSTSVHADPGRATAAEAAEAPVAQRALAVADFSVFVDPPTGFVFVKLPQGWKFSGRLSEAEVARLPGHVLTALLVPQQSTRLVQHGETVPMQ